jgi:magnesium transporter
MFLPPTLIASIYGMNFGIVPELSWTIGCSVAWALMVASAAGPYLSFKRRGWLWTAAAQLGAHHLATQE